MPDIDYQDLRAVLLGRGSLVRAKMLLPEEFHNFIDECYHPTRLAKITTADINKFMEDKPELSRTELLQKLPPWLHDLARAFSLQDANKLPPRQSWDYKIEIQPGREPPY